jgi:[NiFe] hydrogenase diaphorase moiety small subunit
MMAHTFVLDGVAVPFTDGETVLAAALRADHWIPHLCHDPELPPAASCRLCVVEIGGRLVPACATAARADLQVQSNTPALQRMRRQLLQLLFAEGNHICPACEKSGHCDLQATAYRVGMTSTEYPEFFPQRSVDASHDDLWLDFNRCILCGLCVRAGAELDGVRVFALAGRGLATHLNINSPSGQLGDSDLQAEARAARICPVGAILPKRRAFAVPIGERRDDQRDWEQIHG